jgi:uncharacterized protein
MRTVEIKTREGMEEILSRADICYVGIIDLEGNPYVLPMNFGYYDGVVYLHSGPTGSCIDMLRRNNNVCLTFSVGHELVYQDLQVGCSYRMKSKSLICRGSVMFVEEMQAKRKALDIIMKHYTDYPATYSDPAVCNVQVWKIVINSMTAREYAVR